MNVKKWLTYFIIGAVATPIWITYTNDWSAWTSGMLVGAWIACTIFFGIPIGLVGRVIYKKCQEPPVKDRRHVTATR